MKIVGIICEYNPFHLGHEKQLRRIREELGEDCGIVCLMSGDYVQRGAPAIFPKTLRAKAALLSGADLVLELPVTAALSSAEGFAAKGVQILSPFCHRLCFGAETADPEKLMTLATALLSPEFPDALHVFLNQGLSFPAARTAALESMGLDASLLSTPNNILAVEYCKAILSQNATISPMPIHRMGHYHDDSPDRENPSATAVRRLLYEHQDAAPYIPAHAAELFREAPMHCLSAGERGILHRLRTMSDGEFEQLPYGAEGLWRKLMHASRKEATLEQIATAVKSKRYTRSRIDRMILCAFLGLTAMDLEAPPHYARVLGFNGLGREILKIARTNQWLPNLGEPLPHPCQQIETRTEALYGLFQMDAPATPAPKNRVQVLK